MPYVAFGLLAVLLVPGPTNTLLLQSGIAKGLNGSSLRLIGAEWFAYIIQVTAWGLVIGLLGADYSWVVSAVKIFAMCFLLYISLRLWFSVVQDASAPVVTVSPGELFVATLTNPKGLFFVSFVAPPGTFLEVGNYLWFIALFSLVLIPVGVVWVSLGAYFKHSLPSRVSAGVVNRMISLVIGLFALGMLFNMASQSLSA
ncbi:MAG: threonine transporter RhtB [Pseudomonadota bacterium]